jgi:hypothetical protein
MPFFLLTDTHADDQIWDVLAGGRPATRLAIKAAYVDLMSKASHLKTNGYLTHALALQYCGHKRVLDALTRSVLDRPPRLHRRGDECECLAGAEWIDGYEYRLHAFLKRNPSKREYDRNRAQKADLRSSTTGTAAAAATAAAARSAPRPAAPRTAAASCSSTTSTRTRPPARTARAW